MNWDALKQQILAMLIAASKEAVDEFAADYKKYARKLATWTIKATQTADMALLASVQGQLKLLVQRNELMLQKKTMTAIFNVLDIVVQTTLALAQGAVV